MKQMLLAVLLVLGWMASSAEAQERLYHLSMATAIAAHGADLATSEYCAGSGRCREANIFLARFSSQPVVFGAVKMGIAAVSLWATSRIQNKRLATIANFVITGTFTTIAIRNARLR